jgi:two-component system, chemotaxis family, sensor kinase CheA
MESLHATFVNEATELMADLEKGLLQLEADSFDKEGISKVFRSMHTLKGSAGMFGFEAISTLTHHLETVYEAIRSDQQALTPEILHVTFKSLDHLQKLLADPQMNDKTLMQAQAGLLEDIAKLCTEKDPHIVVNQRKVNVDQVTSLYYILIAPHENILRNGTNTLYLIEDLLALGVGIALPYFKTLPALTEIDHQANYMCFEVLLESSKSETDIRDVFMFVESECELNIKTFSGKYISLTEDVQRRVLQGHSINAPQGYETLKTILEADVKQKKEKTGEPADLKVSKTSGSSIRVASERLDELMNLVSELVTTQARLSLFSGHSRSNELSSISENIEKITRRLRDNAFNMSLVPLESLVVRFQRLVRDLSKELNKEVIFKAEGTDTEIDKSIIEKLTDPLLHLLRNSLDHGIETPGERVKKGKPKHGTVLLRAFYSGANVTIEIEDDGAGINLKKVKQKAIAKGLLDAQAMPDEREILELIFLPGFSTAEQVTGVSGRGVGMDVVRKNISDIRGEVEVTTREGQGTTFSIKLPLTLSIIDGLLVRIGETDFILPLLAVNKCYEVETKTLREAHNRWVTLDGERTPYLFLRENFSINHVDPTLSQVIRVAHKGKYVGLAVDRIIGQYQAVLKPLGEQYKKQDEFSGATILGDGSVALVVDTNRLIQKLINP